MSAFRSRAAEESGVPSARRRIGRSVLAAVAVALVAAGCDDQLKHVETFSFMVDGPAVETYEQQPRPAPEGAVPVDGRRSYTLTEADTALTNPLDATTTNLEAGREAYVDFCLPCHGESGAGDGPVVNHTGQHPRRLLDLPTANLLSDRTRGYTDGYIYGMITNGRGMMPAYRRVPRETRWQLVLYVRHLQQSASDSAGGGAATAGSPPGGGDAERAPGDDGE